MRNAKFVQLTVDPELLCVYKLSLKNENFILAEA